MSEELSPELRRLVDLAREGRTPGEGDKLRIAERLAVPLAASVAAGSVAKTAAGAGAKASLLSSWGVKLAAVVALGAAGTLAVVSQRSEPAPPPAPVTAPAPSAPAVESAPALAPAVEEPKADALPATSPREITPPGAHSSKPTHELAQEAALLHEAQAAWRAGQSAQALQLANQHAQRFPKSQLANERDVLRVLSLCKLGQAQAAKQVGARLLRQAKGSPWYQSVADSCAAK